MKRCVELSIDQIAWLIVLLEDSKKEHLEWLEDDFWGEDDREDIAKSIIDFNTILELLKRR